MVNDLSRDSRIIYLIVSALIELQKTAEADKAESTVMGIHGCSIVSIYTAKHLAWNENQKYLEEIIVKIYWPTCDISMVINTK